VSIGLTSYDGGVHFGLNADRDAMPDIDVLADCLESALIELLDTVPATDRAARKGTGKDSGPRRPPADADSA
jgi:hypothetical protein